MKQALFSVIAALITWILTSNEFATLIMTIAIFFMTVLAENANEIRDKYFPNTNSYTRTNSPKIEKDNATTPIIVGCLIIIGIIITLWVLCSLIIYFF